MAGSMPTSDAKLVAGQGVGDLPTNCLASWHHLPICRLMLASDLKEPLIHLYSDRPQEWKEKCLKIRRKLTKKRISSSTMPVRLLTVYNTTRQIGVSLKKWIRDYCICIPHIAKYRRLMLPDVKGYLFHTHNGTDNTKPPQILPCMYSGF